MQSTLDDAKALLEECEPPEGNTSDTDNKSDMEIDSQGKNSPRSVQLDTQMEEDRPQDSGQSDRKMNNPGD